MYDSIQRHPRPKWELFGWWTRGGLGQSESGGRCCCQLNGACELLWLVLGDAALAQEIMGTSSLIVDNHQHHNGSVVRHVGVTPEAAGV